ncbi:hypothetical protein ACLBXI_29915 [Bacillus cereus]
MYILKRKKLKNIVLASIIGFSIAGTSVSVAENTNDINMHQSIKAEDMSIKQLQDAL